MKRLFQNDTLIGVVLALIALAVYAGTLSPSVNTLDGGELAAAVYTLGIGHPTGYPLLMLVAWPAAHLPFGPSAIWRLNLLAALFCSIAIFFFYRVFLLLLSGKTLAALSPPDGNSRRKKAPEIPPAGPLDRLAAAAAALVLAFSGTYWSQAVAFEVYSFHLLFLSLLILLFVRSMLSGKRAAESGPDFRWYGFAFVLGLSFSNHMTTILLAPAFLYLYFAFHGFRRPAWAKIAKAVLPFLAGLLPYLYLPLRAARKPAMNWGDPVTAGNFWWQVSGREFQRFMFSSSDVFTRQLGHFIDGFPSEFGYVPLLFAVMGLAYLFRRSKKALVFSLLLFFGCLFYSLNYDISDISSYFLLAYVAAAIWIAFGMRVLLGHARAGIWRWCAGLLCAGLFLFPLLRHYREVDLSGDYAVEDYARNVLESLEPGAVLLTEADGYLTQVAYYLQLVEGVRPDVAVVDDILLEYPYYYGELGTRFPWLEASLRPEMDAYLKEPNDAVSYPPEVILLALRTTVFKNYAARPVYFTYKFKPEFFSGFQAFPSGLAFRLYRGAPPSPVPPRDFSFHPFPRDNLVTGQIKDDYAAADLNQGLYRLSLGEKQEGIAYLEKALALKPDFPEAVQMLNRAQKLP